MHVLLKAMTSHCTFLRKGVVIMDLLCDEICPMSPLSPCSTCDDDDDKRNGVMEGEDCGHVLRCLMEKEVESLPQKGYSFLVQTNQLIGNARRRAGDWILMSQRRLCLSTGTAFTAMNYLDRFISITRCEGWENWMFELLSLACLTVASKFCDTEIPPLQRFQDMGKNEFHPKLIQKMELTLMKQLGWRMNSTVSFSYISLLLQHSSSQYALIDSFDERITEFLIRALLDPTFLEFRPSLIAISAFRCASQVMFPSKTPFDFDAILPQNQNELMRCQMIMEKKAKLSDEDHHGGNGLIPGICPNPTSPVTVLKPETFEYNTVSTRKRKRREM